MGIKKILSTGWDILSKMNRSALAKTVSSLASAANKRLKRMKQSGEVSPAYRYAERTGGKFSVKGKSVNELRAEYVRAKNFLEQRSSTLKGWKAIKKETVNTLHDMGVDIPIEDIPRVMDLYGEVKEEFPDLLDSAIYAPVIQQIHEEIQAGQDPDTIIDNAKRQMIEGYEHRELINEEFDVGGVSGLL